jgi:hypothetical protein
MGYQRWLSLFVMGGLCVSPAHADPTQVNGTSVTLELPSGFEQRPMPTDCPTRLVVPRSTLQSLLAALVHLLGSL